MTDRDATYLVDMLLACNRILERTRDRTEEDLSADAGLQETVYRQMCVIGEAANQLSEEFQSEYPETPWHGVVGVRNRLIHGYRVIKNDIIWDVVRSHIPALATFLSSIVSLDDADGD